MLPDPVSVVMCGRMVSVREHGSLEGKAQAWLAHSTISAWCGDL